MKSNHTIEELSLHNQMKPLIIKETYFEDERGYTFSVWKDEWKDKYSLPDFVLDKVITGKKGSLRGFHGDSSTWKLFTCLEGEVDLVLLNPLTLEQERIKLSKKNRKSVLVPPAYYNAHQGLKKYVLFYKWSEKYDIKNQGSFNYKCVKWKYAPILSDRDKYSVSLSDFRQSLL